MQLDSSILLILVISSAIFQDTLATGFKRIKVAKCKRGRISSIDLNVTPEFLPEESNSMDTTQYHKVMLPGNNEESNDFGKNTLTTDTQAFSDNSHSFQNPSNPLSGLQTPEHTVNRRKSNHQNVLSAKNSVGHKIFKQKTRPLEDIYKSGAALKDSLSMLESMRTNSKSLASPTKNCEKSRVELREYRTGIRRPKKYNQDSLRSKELSKSGNLQQECSTPQAIQDKTSKHLNSIPQSLAKPNNLDDELLRLISLVKQAQGQGNCSHQTLRVRQLLQLITIYPLVG
ncbi:hypothetical protein DFH28DRAFT_358210 [Melampsora americana]|nr:hypothetical protein DFH28DRAFT_358210 [Melampsora americana]